MTAILTWKRFLSVAMVLGALVAMHATPLAVAKDKGGGDALAQEIADRMAADVVLQEQLDDEVAARTLGDANLVSDLGDETTARTAADSALGADLADEAAARTAADNALGTDLDDEIAARSTGDTDLASDLVTETAARVGADEHLQLEVDAVDDRITALGIAPNVGDTDQVHTQRLTGVVVGTATPSVVTTVPAGTRTSFDLTIPGIRVSDFLSVSPPSTLDGGLVFAGATITGTDTVTIYVGNLTGLPLDVNGTWAVSWIDLTP
jgi:hypothetical protein